MSRPASPIACLLISGLLAAGCTTAVQGPLPASDFQRLGTGNVAPLADFVPAAAAAGDCEPAFVPMGVGPVGAKPDAPCRPGNPLDGPNPGGPLFVGCGYAAAAPLRLSLLALPLTVAIAGICMPAAAVVGIAHGIASQIRADMRKTPSAIPGRTP